MPPKNKAAKRTLLQSPGMDETKSSEIVNNHLNAQVLESTVAVEVDQLLEQAKPRNAEAAARAIDIYHQLCESGGLLLVAGNLGVLVERQCTSEKAVYPLLSELLNICARAVYNGVSALELDDPVRWETRLLQSTEAFDYAPIGSYNRKRPDVAITARAVPPDGYPKPALKVVWINVAAVIEVKWDTSAIASLNAASQNKLDSTCGQLARYILNMYTCQANRRFTWSIFTINTNAYVCLFGRDRIYRTHAMDLGTPDGCKQFAKFLVYWSLAGPVQFGLDPTVQFDARKKEWAIQCFDDTDATHAPQVYYAHNDTVNIRHSLFGRRTTTFFASKQSGGEPEVFLKDGWPAVILDAAGNDPRNEILCLRDIDEHFSTHSVDVPYSKLEMGSVVWQRCHGNWAQDDTTSAYGDIDAALSSPDSDSSLVRREHRRIVTTPLADRLNTLENFNQFIEVLGDVMFCHRVLYDDCKIFHRDISDNNIMVKWKDGAPKGMLVDYDNAIRLDAIPMPGRPARTGTLPFMSIGNLEGNDTDRTALDDWESILYLICWVGTYGFGRNTADDSQEPSKAKPKLHRWLEGTMEDVVGEKRTAMETSNTFSRIHKGFQSRNGVKLLKRLARDLYLALFQHPECSGAEFVDSDYCEDRNLTANSGEDYDPLKARVEYEDAIVVNCHRALQKACHELVQHQAQRQRT
ncbi:hypothetical protein H4R34_000089 [Dimargaris verticillata]|uniref:Fungal-type protein kinase domain-containing protein n=1 Tax=Dimargaris verticillata TaxID=2761393 RepID=A0A9W8EC59_9FUNG|nr:hypothetical protein H4R34_000089 [Dimargaris verticillata]